MVNHDHDPLGASMFAKIRQSNVFILLAIAFAFVRLIFNSICMNLFKYNTRQLTDKQADNWSARMLAAVQATATLKGDLPNFQDGRPYIIISNHTSHYDIPAVFATIPASVRMVGKKELFNIPFFGWSMRRHEFVCIDRRNREQAVKDLSKARDLMQSGVVIWIAAEGTRSRTGQLQAFKKGVFMLAIDAQAVIVPMMIEGANRILPPDTLKFSTGEQVTVHVGPCVDTAGFTAENRDVLMAKVRGIMEGLVGEP
jgi:1-acyl-sn-glycerol-3-phosphate acyltransferase